MINTADDRQFPTWVRYSLLALQSLPEAERHDVAAKAGIPSLMPNLASVDTPATNPQIGGNDGA